jgi:hypothetical protein
LFFEDLSPLNPQPNEHYRVEVLNCHKIIEKVAANRFVVGENGGNHNIGGILIAQLTHTLLKTTMQLVDC